MTSKRLFFLIALALVTVAAPAAARPAVPLAAAPEAPPDTPPDPPADRPAEGRIPTRRRLQQVSITLTVLAAMAAVSVLVHHETTDYVMISYWYFGVSIITLCLGAFVVGRRYLDNPVAEGKVLCIVPAYNEDPAGLHATVVALLAQTVPIDIVVIDDGSQIPVVPSIDDPRVTWMRQDNTGKRGAQVTVLKGISRDVYQFVLTVDSDSQPYPDACEHLLRAMHDPRIQAATGMIYIRNFRESWVSLAADIDIGCSCVMMRASRSMLGALETTSGALALYRSALLYDHLEAYAVECGTGDDRWLALRALRRGQVVAVAEALVQTDMPATLKGTYRQRLRWARSWWWMLPYVGKYLGLRQFISPMYGLIQLIVTPIMVIYIVAEIALSAGGRYSSSGGLDVLLAYAGAYVAVRFGLSALYLLGRPNVPYRQKLRLFFVGTLASVFLNLILLTPTRYVALSKLFDNRWQTRELPAGATDRTNLSVT